MDFYLSRVHFPITSLGPGRRLGIWFQGCGIRCPGCISADTWAGNRGKTTLERLLAHIAAWLPEAEGITISGGEPFEQPDALIALLRALRQQTSVDILVYSGHPIEALTPTLAKASGLIDVLISDPFDLDAPHTRPLRGSDNQRMHLLTALGGERFTQYERLLTESDKSLDVMFDDAGSVWLAGIPGRGDFQRLKGLLNEKGHLIQISADKARSR
ncbi:4Fe-4S single cluster domain-containing protein [Cupriavidus taiwanensis]|uniref:Radical SAM domain protein n=1 Tax=Cupriavidus taiwanensis TaxID=164546 RepID=A0A7Z7JIV7_9BURK|nr:4Fe-4S single cluster domain-containing protein [Cupriavidus taiwanensis]SOZ19205.1 Radical SAM domain protein [Cupriavidus taiwanensis]SOZ97236.1 Radical SAM domain protein [Cupriavidus taiwanensis]SPC26130.1 Radical SAM domain protein [Cupriavidus taiwanensis]SPD37740.1 Radical SAM domain protein [Cupriavidus taiwanensis]